MADIKWSSFPSATSLTGSEYFTGLQSGINVLFPLSTNVLTYFNTHVQISEGQVTNLPADLASKLNLNGSNSPMTGFLTLNADPTANLQAATKQYVDNSISSAPYVLKVGDTMTGNLIINADLSIGTSTNVAPLTTQVGGGTTYSSSVAAYFGSVVGATGGNFYQISIAKGSYEAIITGINKDSTTGNIPANYAYFSTFSNFGGIALAQGDNTGLPATANLLINGSGQVDIPNSLIVGPSFSPISSNVKLFMMGTDASGTDSPNIGFFTTADNYPLMQIYPFSHGNVFLNFDCYSTSGNTYSSDPGSNFQLAKSNNQLQFNYRSGISQGSSVAFQQAGYLDTSGIFNYFIGLSLGPTQLTVQKNIFTIMGADSTLKSSVNFYTNFDQYPLLQIEPYTHDNVNVNFDCYYNGSNFLSSNTTSNFQISKNTNLSINYSNGISQGGTITWGTSLFVSPTGQINLPNLSASMYVATDPSNNLISINPPITEYVLVSATSQQMVINTTYIITGTSTVTFILPPTNASIGQVTVCGYGNANWIVQTNAGQTIIDNGLSSTISATSSTVYDNVTFIYAGNNSGIFQVVYQNGMQINLT